MYKIPIPTRTIVKYRSTNHSLAHPDPFFFHFLINFSPPSDSPQLTTLIDKGNIPSISRSTTPSSLNLPRSQPSIAYLPYDLATIHSIGLLRQSFPTTSIVRFFLLRYFENFVSKQSCSNSSLLPFLWPPLTPRIPGLRLKSASRSM